MTCRQCDKIEPRGCGKTCCEVTGKVVMDFDKECDCEQNTGTISSRSVETGKSN